MRFRRSAFIAAATVLCSLLAARYAAPARRESTPLAEHVGTKAEGIAPAAAMADRQTPAGDPSHSLPAAAARSGAIEAFSNWTERYLHAEPAQRAAIVAEGIELARARRPAFKTLIQEDPQRAIETAVPMVVRQQLPLAVLAQLEKRVNQRADLRVYQGVPPPGQALTVKTLTHRIAALHDGPDYEAHVYGRRAQDLLGTRNDALNGVALDNQFAVNEEPVRVLETGEKPDPGKEVVTSCPVSGKQVVTGEAAGAAVPEDTTAVETPEQTVYLCGGYHKAAYAQLYAEGGTGGPIPVQGILPAAPTPALGMVKILYIPLTFQDQNAIPATETACYGVMRDVSDYYLKSSYGKLTTITTVTPPIKLPKNEAWYVQRDTSNGGDVDGLSLEMAHAREEARRIGFDYSDYDCTVVRLNGGARPVGGWGGGGNVWVYSDSIGVCAHEIGHSFGLAHANFWDTAGTSAIGPGANQEYGDQYDVMGGGGVPTDHYNAAAKNQVKWLPDNFVKNITSSGLYRLYAFDQPVLDPRNDYALTVTKDALRTYWGELRQNYSGSTSRPWVDQGMLLGWKFPAGGGSNIQLIDTTPGSPYSKDDAPIALGQTFSDSEAGIYMTTVGVSTTTPKYVDVVVNLGSFPGNHPPTLSLSSSAGSIPVGATVTFAADAVDPDGDTLAYQWQHWGDTSIKIVSPNAPTITRTFTTAGSYVVSCTVSDMKGGTATREKMIVVGNGNGRFTIAGRVTVNGAGVPGVLLNANGTNPVITDADGNYTITNLAANTYSVTPLLYGYSFTELFNNSITVGPNFSGADFDAAALPTVTIGAPDASATEGATPDPATFRLTRTGDLSQSLTVNVSTATGTASTGDYTLSPTVTSGSPFNSFTIPADSATLDITVTPVNDSTVEGPETLTYSLAAGAGYLIGGIGSATITIDDDDTALPKVGIVATNTDTVENAASPGVFTITRTGSTAAALTVNYTIGGTATPAADYAVLPGTITLPIGAASAVINVVAIDDSLVESLETVVVTISSNAAYIVNPVATSATVNIIDDHTNVVNVVATDPVATEVDLSQPGAVADTGTFLITRSGDTSQALTVYYSFAGTTATGNVPALNGVDFEALPGVAQIPAGSSSASVTIVPRWDNLGEPSEQVELQLGAGPTNYKVGPNATAMVTINDAPGSIPYIDVINTSLAAEPSTSGNFRFTARNSANVPITIHYTVSGTATNGVDYDSGLVWVAQASGITTPLRATWGTGATSLWAVGDNGVIVKWDGTSWTAQASNTTANLRGLWGSSATSIWAVGDGGTILKWDGSAWSAQTSNTANTLRGVWGNSATSVWAVGDAGTVMKWDGTSWTAQNSGVTTILQGVWGSDASNVWAVGEGGVIRKWGGSSWAAQTSGVTTNLSGVWGNSSTSVWTVGGSGTVRKWNGTSWSGQSSGTTFDLTAVWGADASNLWACGGSGVLVRTTNGGSTWTAQNSNCGRALSGLWGSGATNVWAVGDGGSTTNYNTALSAPLNGIAVIPAGATTLDLAIRPINDAVPEDLESIILTIVADAAYQTFTPTATATMWLKDDDQPTVWVDTQVGSGSGASNRFTEGGTTSPVKFYVSRSGATTNPLTVNFSLTGLATVVSDYTVTTSATLSFDNASGTGVLTIPAGSQGADVPLTVVNDSVSEGTETIVFSLGAGSYARTPAATLFIDDDTTDGNANTQKVFFGGTSAAALESVGTATIPVNLTNPATAPVSVEYAIDSGARSSATTGNNTQTLPYWVRMEKVGNAFASYCSTDGVTWVKLGTTQTISFASNNYLAGLCVTSHANSTLGTAIFDNVSVTALSIGGSQGAATSADIGSVGVTGSYSVASGAYTVSGSGSDIFNSADAFRYVWFPISNSANCTITARVLSQSVSDAWAKAGVMIRESSAAGSRQAMTAVTPGNGRTLQYRSATNGSSTNAVNTTALLRPLWVRLTRVGNVFTASQSPDGATWTTVGTPQTIALSSDVLAGLAVSARSDGSLSTAVFDNVSLTGSPTLIGRTVGYVNVQGSDSLAAGTYTIIGSGAQIGGTEDECYFDAAPVTGDFTIVARVVSQSGGAVNAQAGVMVRENQFYRVRSLYLGSVANAGTEFITRDTSVTTAFGDGIDFTLPTGVLSFAVGEQTKNITLSISDDAVPEPDENVTIILRNANGAQITAPSTFTYTIIDNDSSPAAFVGFASSGSTVTEGTAGTVNLPVCLSAPVTSNVTVGYAVTGGTATTDDYTFTAGTRTFAPGETVKYIPITIVDDTLSETNETVIVTLTDPTGASLGTLSAHTLTITDDDAPVVSIVASDANAAEAGLDKGQFTITRTGPTPNMLTVTLARDATITAGIATNGADYNSISANAGFTVTIPAGSSSATIDIIPVDDSLNEGNETVTLTVNAGSGYIVGAPSTATVTIADDDRSTVTIVANDNSASETPGDPGQFTVTRTAPTSGALTVNLTISGTATNNTDYATIATSISIPANQTSATINVAPVDDLLTEGDETVIIQLASGSYTVGGAGYDVLTIHDNDAAPTVYVTSPSAQGTLVPSGEGVVVSAYASDDGAPQPLVLTWSQASGPGTATFATPNAASSAVSFSADGVYVLRITATDGQFTVSDQVVIVVGSAIAPAQWIAQDMSPSTQQRGQSAQVGSSYVLTGMGAGYASTTTDAAHVMARQVSGNGSLVARITAVGGPASAPLAGVTIRDSLARSCARAVLGYVPGAGLQFRTRTTASVNDTVTTQGGITLPIWVKLDLTGTTITASYASDSGTVPATWTQLGSATAMTLANNLTEIGLTATSNSSTAGNLCSATFDNVTLTPSPGGPALVTEDFGTTTPTASTFAVNAGTYTIASSGSMDSQGAFYGWQYYGDVMITARETAASSTALSAKSGIMIRESMDSTAGYIHIGRIPQGAFSGFIWRTLASGSGGGVPSFTGAVRWVRLVRRGNRVTGFHAPDVSGSPGTWTQLGQPQTIIMSTPVLVGFAVDNSGGTAGVLNTVSFDNLSVVQLNKAPTIDLTLLPSTSVGPATLDASVTDDASPAPTSLTTTWSKSSGSGAMAFTDSSAVDTTATFSEFGDYTLRLAANDSGIIAFREKTIRYYDSQFQQWQSQSFAGDPNSPNAAPDADPDGDGLTNLVEYALNLSPMSFDRAPWAVDSEPLSGANYLRLTVPKNPAATDVTYEVEATSDVTSAVGWSSNGLTIEQNSATTLQVRDSVPIGSAAHRFMRVKVSR